MKLKAALLGAGLAAASFAAGPALADIPVSGTGSNGFMDPTGSQEWSFNADNGAKGNDWGSPGVSIGEISFTGTETASGLDLTFSGGGLIDPESIIRGNGANCEGSSFGGTTFCTVSPTDIWIANLVGVDSIQFRAQNPTVFLSPGQKYFVDVFLSETRRTPSPANG